jgi:predicted Zn-dependent protease
MKFSQKQELKADYYALDLLQKAYGNVDGAVEFMSQMSDADNNDQFTYFFATHPYPKTRLQLLKNKIQDKGYSQSNPSQK